MNWDGIRRDIGERRRLTALFEAGLLDATAFEQADAWMMPKLDWGRALSVFLLGLGVVQLLVGVVFFFAHNWSELSRFEKLGLIQVGLVVCLVGAWRKGVSTTAGVAWLFSASTFIGVLFAVFGQIYQTGADVYTLFANWAGLTLAWVLVARSRLLWVQWFVIAATAFGLWGEQIAAPTHGWHSLLTWAVLGFGFAGVALYAELEREGRLPALGLGGLRELCWAAMLGFLIAPNTELIWMERYGDMQSKLNALGLGAVIACGALLWSWRRDLAVKDRFPRLCLSAYYLLYLVLVVLFRVIHEMSSHNELKFLFMGLIIIGGLTLTTQWLMRRRSNFKEERHD